VERGDTRACVMSRDGRSQRLEFVARNDLDAADAVRRPIVQRQQERTEHAATDERDRIDGFE
jgi:hypothetical protein